MSDKIGVKTKVFQHQIVQEVFSERDGIRDTIQRHVIGIRDQQVRDALVSLGWTPPEDKRNCRCDGCRIEKQEQRIRKLMSVHAEAEDELKDMTRRFWKQVEETETAHRRIRELEEQPR